MRCKGREKEKTGSVLIFSGATKRRGLKYYLLNWRRLGKIKICVAGSKEVAMRRRNRKQTG